MLNRDLIGSARLPELHREYVTAQPFPHIVVDGLFDHVHLDGILGEFDGVDRADWIFYDNANEVKFGTRPNAQLGPAAQAYFDTIHRGQFISFLSALTGIPGLVPDPMLRGGGLHEIPVGGQFKVHTDFTRHTDTLLDNRLVVITYLNKEWLPSYGGALELWTKEACVREVIPLFGRTIIFSQSAESLHGHPRPVATPDGRTRRSVAAYFYTNGRPDASPPERVGTKFLFPGKDTPRQRLTRAAKYIVPPILIDGIKMARRLTGQTR